eukprot:3409458-Rhodomonas_salina.1
MGAETRAGASAVQARGLCPSGSRYAPYSIIRNRPTLNPAVRFFENQEAALSCAVRFLGKLRNCPQFRP